MKRSVEVWLRKFPMVSWDRFVRFSDGISAFGWIQREDAYKDFMIIDFDKSGDLVYYMTSSKRYSLPLYKIINGTGRGHTKCRRVEHAFRIKNSIKLSTNES